MHKFVLGAKDPEMKRIEQILISQGCEYQYATNNGKDCHPGNAYKCDPVDVVYVECRPEGLRNAKIDHHWPGDPGYGLPADRFWDASSLGQIYEMLGILNPSHDDLILAAMDHNPAGAIRGECPGVSAHDVLERKVAEIASATKVSPDEVRSRIQSMSNLLDSAPEIEIGGQALKDLRSEYLGEGYNVELLSAQVASLAGGYACLLRHRDKEGDDLEKWSISGHASPECIESFLEEWGPANGLTGRYGVPARRYAGGYLPE